MATLITLSYTGGLTNSNEIEFYDIAHALIGFQRSLALTTHLVLNDEVIIQAPALKGATILAKIPEDGSWKFTAAVMVTIYTLGTAPKDTPIGHLISSAYDYVVSEALGFHVDYDKTLGQQYNELHGNGDIKVLPQHRFDSVVEKCEPAIKDMHRPISASETATQAKIRSSVDGVIHTFQHPLTLQTYEYLAYTERTDRLFTLRGRVSSYNSNTFKGRMYLATEGRPIPFELDPSARGSQSVATIIESLRLNAQRQHDRVGEIEFKAFRNLARSGRLKSLYVTEVVGLIGIKY
jgi:hypothetical protein